MALTILAWLMIIVFMFMIMTKRLSPFTSLIIVPLVFVLIGSFMGLYATPEVEELMGGKGLLQQLLVVGEWIKMGVTKTAPTGVMLLFAILYFAIMLNAGMFDPLTRVMLKFAGGDPMRVLIATGVVAAAVSLNGDGTTTTLITCTTFLPIYKKLNMKLMNLAVVTVLMNTIMNLLPWGGPSARVASVLPEVDTGVLLAALAPGMIVSLIYMVGVSAYMGKKERARLGIVKLSDAEISNLVAPKSEEEEALKRPKNVVFNWILTLVLIVFLLRGWLPSLTIFMIGTIVALIVNYPNLKEEKARIADNAGDALQVVILVFAAGAFTGLFENSGMSTALANSIASIIPSSWGSGWGLVTAFLSAPGTFFLSNDAFYYGVLPVLNQTGALYGWSALELGTASLLGQAYHLLSPLVAFIYLLLSLTEQDLGEWQRESAKWATGIFIIFIGMAAITGNVPLFK
ncbi:MAG: citrate:proton symporter [Peptoniphilaceae bacterium]|nr:citrate:proton symporter [Peptoniphilaceae bacterium]MDY6085464.1 citrate:proton symporter [Peptoniphilaceae bacterium]